MLCEKQDFRTESKNKIFDWSSLLVYSIQKTEPKIAQPPSKKNLATN